MTFLSFNRLFTLIINTVLWVILNPTGTMRFTMLLLHHTVRPFQKTILKPECHCLQSRRLEPFCNAGFQSGGIKMWYRKSAVGTIYLYTNS